MSVILALWEAETGGLLELRNSIPAWARWQNPVSTKNNKISWVWWLATIVPATLEAELPVGFLSASSLFCGSSYPCANPAGAILLPESWLAQQMLPCQHSSSGGSEDMVMNIGKKLMKLHCGSCQGLLPTLPLLRTIPGVSIPSVVVCTCSSSYSGGQVYLIRQFTQLRLKNWTCGMTAVGPKACLNLLSEVITPLPSPSSQGQIETFPKDICSHEGKQPCWTATVLKKHSQMEKQRLGY
ncbi:hypothetical protein AAY473_024502 [Plecturocebus cupreus]